MPLPPVKKEKNNNPGLQKGNTGSQTLDYGLLPTGVDSWGGGGGGGGLYLTLQCHHQNGSSLRRAAVKPVLMFH